MNSRYSTVVLLLVTTLGCSPATGGLGLDSGSDESAGSETASDSGGSESADAEGSSSSGDGDGDGAPGDGDGGPGDGDPGDGDGSPGDGDGDPGGVCGDGTVDAGEDCDGDNLDGRDCLTLGFAGGSLSCDGSCKFDTSACEVDLCGNGMIDPGEECDGNDIGSADCIMLGEGPGTPSCDGQCMLDLSTCGVPGEGQNCDFWGNCPDNLYCEDGKCYDGSLGDPCSWDNDCLSGNCSNLIGGQCE